MKYPRLQAIAWSLPLLLACSSGIPARAADPAPATQQSPAPAAAAIDASDKAALEANLGKQATVSGTITKAEWSKSGKVMNVEFEKGEFTVAVFDKNKEAIDQAFAGDATKAWTGAKVTVTGKIAKYGGRAKELEGKFQITVSDAKQVTVVQAKQ